MSNEIQKSEAITGSTTTETQLQQFNQLLSSLTERVAQLEENFRMVTDVYKHKKLRDLLAAGNLQEADRETIQVILTVTGKPDVESITPDDMRQFPCDELGVIDNLWTTYSKGRFGFSIQMQIYQDVGGSLDTTISQDYAVIERFGDRVGWYIEGKWQKCDELDYTLAAPMGCHPSRWWNSPFGSKMTNYFFNRLLVCNL
ncbi:hypothetical protein NUACC21_36170 [Scytonema sp. NUACC21]